MPAPSPAACAHCEQPLAADSRFCENCGASVARRCPRCGEATPAAKPFCRHCGTGLATSRPPADGADSPGSEGRRVVSILFADLVGFTALASERDPEAIRTIQAHYFGALRATAARFGGTVEKFIGDAVVMVFGAPTGHEDDAERSVRAALEITALVSELGHDLELELEVALQARVAICRGEVAVHYGREDEGLVSGSVVNLASRLQALAEPGGVLVDDPTHAAVPEAVTYAEPRAVSVRGHDTPLRVWQPLHVVARRGGDGRNRGIEPPFVGRTGLLRQLRGLVEEVAADGRAWLISITGNAGMGKSRLVWELLKYLDGVTLEVRWLNGEVAGFDTGSAFGPLAQMLQQNAGIADDDGPEVIRVHLEELLDRIAVADDERDWLRGALETLLGLSTSTLTRDELLGAWRRWLEYLTQDRPLVLVFEEMHAANADLLDFVASLPTWLGRRPLLVLAVARPDLLERNPGWGGGQRRFAAMPLDPLSESAMRELIVGVVPAAPDALVGRIVAQAEGIPLYAVEILRMLRDQGSLHEAEKGLATAGDIVDIAMPDSLRSLIVARVDRLDEPERRLLRAAAVLGGGFPEAALRQLIGGGADIDSTLARLVRSELLRPEVGPAGTTYTFVQPSLGEVTYAMLPMAERGTLHVAAARHLEATEPRPLATIAAHYARAHGAARSNAERTRLAEAASDWLVRAARQSVSSGAADEALRLLNQARLLAPAERGTAIEELTGDAARALNSFQLATDSYRAAEHLLEAHGNAAATISVRAKRMSALLDGGHLAEAIEVLHLERPAGAEQAHRELATLFVEGARVARNLAYEQGHREASELTESALLHAEQVHDALLVERALCSRAVNLIRESRFIEGEFLATALLEAAEAREDNLAIARALNVKYWSDSLDSPRLVIATLRRCVELERRVGEPVWVARALDTLEEELYAGDLVTMRSDLAELEASQFYDDGFEANNYHNVLAGALHFMTVDRAAGRAQVAGALGDMRGQIEAMRKTALLANELVALLDGDLRSASEMSRAAESIDDGANDHRSWWLSGLTAVALGDAGSAERFATHLLDVPGRWPMAAGNSLAAGVQTIRGDAGATEALAAALAAWDELAVPMAGLLCHRCIAPHSDAPPEMSSQVRDLIAHMTALTRGAQVTFDTPGSRPPSPVSTGDQR